MADLVRVAQFGGQVRDTAQDALSQAADARLQREGGAQGVCPRLERDADGWLRIHGSAWPFYTGLVEWKNGYAFVCLRHALLTHIVTDPLNLIAECVVCEAEHEATASRLRRQFVEAMRHG